MSTEGGTRAVLAALGANVGVAIAKFVAWAITGSSSMLTEGIHSIADSANQVLLLIGRKRSERERDDEHPFGYGRLRYVYAFLVAIVLFLVGGVFSLYEGWHKIQHPEELNDPVVAFVVLGVAVVLEGLSLRTAFKEANKSRGRRSVFGFVRRTRNPELPVILLEDSGAVVGLLLATFGVTMATVTGDGRWDGVGAAGVGVLLIVIALFLAAETASLLTGEGALPEQVVAITHALSDTEGVERVIHMRTLHLGPDDLLVAAKIAVTPTDRADEVAQVIDRAEQAVRESVKLECVVYLEPDIYDPARAAAPGAQESESRPDGQNPT